MLFSEIYGSYFQVVSDILAEAAQSNLTDKRMTELVQKKAFSESTLSIPASLKDGSWPLLDGEFRSVLQHAPSMPMTTLQKRWLKALLLDPRIKLFGPDPAGLEHVEPLYRADTFVYFDRYADGDPYEDPEYIANFRTIRQAISERRKMRIRFRGHTGVRHSVICIPFRLEYSSKDDKFRLLAAGGDKLHTVNVSRIRSCELLEPYDPERLRIPRVRLNELVLVLHDERNALERALLHFSHFEKETRKLDEDTYQIKIRYDRDDETELLIRVLSFGPMLKAVSPDRFVNQLKQRVEKQMAVGRKS